MQKQANSVRIRLLEALLNRKIKPTSQKFLSQIGYSSGTVSDYLGKNATKEPSEKFVREICEIFGFSFEQIWLGTTSSEKLDQLSLQELKAVREALEVLNAFVNRIENNIPANKFGESDKTAVSAVGEYLQKDNAPNEGRSGKGQKDKA